MLGCRAGLAQNLPRYLADRGTGIATSMFGEYIRPGELPVYPFYEYTSQNLEYKPSELGYRLDQDFRGRFREHEALVFLAFSFGTITARTAAEHEQEDKELIFGEYALEYLKKLSPSGGFTRASKEIRTRSNGSSRAVSPRA